MKKDYGSMEFKEVTFGKQINVPLLYLNVSRFIALNQATINALKDSEYAQLYVSEENRVFAVRPCKKEDLNSFRFHKKSNTVARNPGREIHNLQLFTILTTLIENYDEKCRYAIPGELDHSTGTLYFDLSSAKVAPVHDKYTTEHFYQEKSNKTNC